MEDDFDEVIDQALSEYTYVAVPVGLELRVIRSVQDSSKGKTLFGAGALFSLAASVLLLVHSGNRPPELHLQNSRLIFPASIYLRPLQMNTMRKHRAAKHLAAKQSVFPIPSPLNSEERLLVALANQAPIASEEFRGYVNDQPIQIKPIQIEPIQIVPLPEISLTGENR